MNGSEDDNLADFAEYLAATTDAEVREKVRAALADEDNPLAVLLRGVQENDRSFLTLVLRASRSQTKRPDGQAHGRDADLPSDDLLEPGAIAHCIRKHARPYIEGELPIAELHNRDLVERVRHELLGDREFSSMQQQRNFFLHAGRVVAELIAAQARARLQSGEPITEANLASTAALSRDTTLSLSSRYPRVVLARQEQLDKLAGIETTLSETYILHIFAGRTVHEIAQLTGRSEPDVAEALEIATVEVCLND